MVKFKSGNIIDNAIGILAYPVNTRGAMEDELGTQIKALYPKVFQAYSHACNGPKYRNLGGKADIIAVNGNIHVAMMYVRTRNYGEGIDYNCLRDSLAAVRDFAERRHLLVCIPMFGTEREQGTIRTIFREIFSPSQAVLTVWIADHQVIGLPPSAYGKESMSQSLYGPCHDTLYHHRKYSSPTIPVSEDAIPEPAPDEIIPPLPLDEE